MRNIQSQRSTTDRASPSLIGVALTSLVLLGCGGGADDGSVQTSQVGVRFSDAPVEQADEVVIEVASLTFVPEVGEPIVVDTFSSAEMETEQADSFRIDLLDYTGEESLLVLDQVELPVGVYKNLLVHVVDESTDHSWVLDETSPTPKLLKVPSGVLKLGGFEVSDVSAQQFVVEFGLRSSLTYNPGPDRYILKPRGVRIVGLAEAASLSVAVDPALCPVASEGSLAAILYAYAGSFGPDAVLGDMFNSEDTSATDDSVRPMESVMAEFPEQGGDGSALFSFLPPGEYTIALACTDDVDNPELADLAIQIPFPIGASTVVSLTSGESAACSFASADSSDEDATGEPLVECE